MFEDSAQATEKRAFEMLFFANRTKQKKFWHVRKFYFIESIIFTSSIIESERINVTNKKTNFKPGIKPFFFSFSEERIRVRGKAKKKENVKWREAKVIEAYQ